MPQPLEQTYRVVPDGIDDTKEKVSGLFGALKRKARDSNSVLGKVAASIVNIGKSAKVWIAGAAVTGFAALAGAVGKATGEAVKFEEDLARIATLIDGDVQGSLDRFASGIDRIRTQLPVTENLTRALYDTISAGVDVPDSIGFLEDAARAATAGMTDTRTAVDALTSALNAFGKDVEEAEDVSDSFFQAIDAGKTTFPELASEMGKVLPLASQLGVSLDEVNAALATLTTTGLSTAEAATSLRGIFNQLIQGQERFREAGIEVNEVLGERGLLGLLQEVQEQTGGSASATRELFRRVEALNGVLALSGEQMGTFVSNLEAMSAKAGATDEAVSQVEKSVSSLWQVTKNQLNVAWRRLGTQILPTLNAALRSTNELLESASSTGLDRLLSQIEQMEGIDPEVEARLRGVQGVRQAEERVEEIEEQLQEEITVGVDFSTRPSTNVRGPIDDFESEELEERLKAVNEALAERANRIAELEGKEGDLSETQQQTLEMAKRRRVLLEGAREDLLKGIETLSRFEAAQEAASEARDRLSEALSDDPAAQSGGGSGGGLPEVIEQLVGLESLDEVSPKTRQAIGDWVDAFQERVKARVADVQGTVGGEGFTRLFGFDAEAMNEQIAQLRERLEAGEITPAEFAEEARSVAQEYRGDLNDIIDTTVRLTTLSEEAGKRLKRGLKPARDEAQALRTDFIQAVGRLEGQIGTDQLLQVTKGIRDMSDQALKAEGSLEGVLSRLKQSEEVDSDAIEAVREALEGTTEQAEDLGEALQDTARAVRGIGDLASQFGDLSDEAEQAIDSTASLLSNVGRLVELSDEADGFSNIFSSFPSAVSGVTTILGAAGGLANLGQSLFSGADDGLSEERLNELRRSINSNVRALKENTRALLEQSTVGRDLEENTVNEAISLFEQLEGLTIEGSGDIESVDEARSLLRQLEETGIEAFSDVQEIFNESLEQDGDEFEALNEVLTNIRPTILSLEQNFGKLGTSLDGLIKEIELRRTELGQGRDAIRSVIVDRLGDVGFDDPLTEGLRTAIEELDLSDESAVESFLNGLTEAIIGSGDLSFLGIDQELPDLLGEASPAEFEEFVATLRENLLGEEGAGADGDDFTTSAQIQRTITELQANELLSFQRELVQLGRSQRDLLAAIVEGVGGDLPGEGEPSASTIGPSDLRAAFDSGGGRSGSSQRQVTERLVSKSIGGDNFFDINIDARGLSEKSVAQKLDEEIRRHLPRR